MPRNLIFDVYAAEEIAGDDVEGRSFRVGVMCGMVAYAADKTAAYHYDIDMGGHEELDAAAERVDVYLLVLGDNGLAQIHTDAAAEGVKAGTMKGLAAIDVLVTAVVNRAADALAVLADGQRALEPLVGVATIALDDEAHAYIYQQEDGEISCPGLLAYPCKPTPMDNAPDGRQFQQTGYDENNSDKRSWFHNHNSIKNKLLQRYGLQLISPNFWDKQHGNVTDGILIMLNEVAYQTEDGLVAVEADGAVGIENSMVVLEGVAFLVL